jgi:hypothetical protein
MLEKQEKRSLKSSRIKPSFISNVRIDIGSTTFSRMTFSITVR